MRLQISKSKNSESFYIIKSFRDNKTKKNTSQIVERLGTRQELEEKLGRGVDVEAWARKRAEELTEADKAQAIQVNVGYDPQTRIDKGVRRSFCGGYLFLQDIYHKLGLDDICADITRRSQFTYDLDSILSRLVYGRILHPSSKRSTYGFSKTLIEAPLFDPHQMYRALGVLARETDFIQASLYERSKKVLPRKDKILYYDCTNFFFEIEQEDDFREYGHSKEHRPNPIVSMGLFMDASGMPLAFCMNPGAANEQPTMVPLEKKIIEDFDHSRFVVCTDAGLSSASNKMFNTRQDRQFITTQSIRKLKKHLKSWATDPGGWSVSGSDKTFDLHTLDALLDSDETSEDAKNAIYNKTFYKERMVKESVGAAAGKEMLEQRLVVTFSFKYRTYQRNIRQGQIDRALRAIETNSDHLKKNNQHDYRRLVKKTNVTKEGEVAGRTICELDQEAIEKEAAFDGFYGLTTSLDGSDIEGILQVNANRWEIEECFRIMKSEFKARPTYLTREDRIRAHFLTCFIALLIHRIIEHKLDQKYTCSQIIDGLRSMDFKEIRGEGFEPLYMRTDFTDDLHDVFGFHTDYQIITDKAMKKIIRQTKKA